MKDEIDQLKNEYWFGLRWYRIWPVRWQGYALIIGFTALIIVLSVSYEVIGIPAMVVCLVLATISFTIIVFRKMPPLDEW